MPAQDITLVEKELGAILPQQVILTITVTATSTIGKPLSDEDLKKVPSLARSLVCRCVIVFILSHLLPPVRLFAWAGSCRCAAVDRLSLVSSLLLAYHLFISLSLICHRSLVNCIAGQVNDACDAIIRLDEYKKQIFHYIESRMAFIAPNLSAIVGSEIAARYLLALVGIEY
mgnify:CR=1 FL=1